MAQSAQHACRVTDELSDYIATALAKPIPEDVLEKAKHHTLDTLASVISGSRLKPGEMAIKYVQTQGGTPEATIPGTRLLTSAINAALANGMMAHADETDDSHAGSRTHPGCAIVPAAWAMGERDKRSGRDMLRAVVLGYDVCCRMTKAMGVHVAPRSDRSTHTLGGIWGAAAAAGALAGLDAGKVHYLISYTAQQTSGVSCWQRDEEHVEKAFDFAGMPARNGVTSAVFVSMGYTGVWDSFSGPHNYFDALARKADPEALVDGLGSRFEIMGTNIKRWTVGSPIIAALDALVGLIEQHKLTADQVDTITARIPDSGLRTVDNRLMPDVCLQHVLAVTLLDGGFSFHTAHDYVRMQDPKVLDIRRRITAVGDAELTVAKPPRQGIVELVLRDGRRLRNHVKAVKGTADNPMTRAEVEDKCRDLIAPIVGAEHADKLIRGIWDLERVGNVVDLRSYMQAD